jgi:type I restriction enzyme M protein
MPKSPMSPVNSCVRGVSMLDLKLQRAIDEAVKTACLILRGAADVSDVRDFVLAMLLLKYLSDSSRYTHGTKSGSTDPATWVVPEGSDFYTLHAAMHQAGNGKRIDDALRAIEDANPSLRAVFQGRGFNSTALGNNEQKDRVLSQLLSRAPALDFRGGGPLAADAVAFACDSLVRQAAEASGRRGGEFFTPPEISRLIAGFWHASAHMQSTGAREIRPTGVRSVRPGEEWQHLGTGKNQHGVAWRSTG